MNVMYMAIGDMFNRSRNALRRHIRACEAYARSAWLRLAAEVSRSPMTHSEGPVVSLTSYGDRVKNVYIAIESIAQGKVKPSRVILWLDSESANRGLPGQLRKQQQRGLEIRICADLGPHKKYYPYLESCDVIEVPLVTADDDLVYPRWWLKGLVDEYRKHPEVVNCYRARRIQFSGRKLASYKDWELTKSTEPSFCDFAGSGAGAILPIPLQRFIRSAGTRFLDCCPRADDIWLHVQALRAGYRVRQIHSREFRLLEIPRSQQQALHLDNLAGGGNDRQIVATYDPDDLETLRTYSDQHATSVLREEEAHLSITTEDGRQRSSVF